MITAILLAALQLPQDSGAPLEIGRTFRLASRVLGETRVIDVSLPPRYDANTADRYPVVFVLDGEFEHQPAVAIARFYGAVGMLPPLIVVGIRNTDRMRDMTPAAAAGFRMPPEAAASGGGADRFLAFLSDELVPWVDGRYRTAPMRVLVGHSLGGLLTVYALAQRPELFGGWLVMEPSIWWNNHREYDAARAVLRSAAGRQERFMAVNTQSIGVDTTRMGGDGPMVRFMTTQGENHSSMALAGMMMGLRTMFADFRPAPWRPGTRPIAMLDHYDSLAFRLGYAPPIPASAFSLAVRMSLDARWFDDAERGLGCWERALGASAESQRFRARLEAERAAPPPAGFIQLEIPARRPSPRDARRFLGRWESIGDSAGHVVDVRASGDTIIVHDRIRQIVGEYFEGDNHVIQVTADGTLEWGLPWFRGLAALVVLKGRLLDDNTMEVRREPRGWLPREPGADFSRVQRFRRVR